MTITGSALPGNVNEIVPITIVNRIESYIKNTPIEITFPEVPIKSDCVYADYVSDTKFKLKSIKSSISEKKVIIKPSNFFQQSTAYCNIQFSKTFEGFASVSFDTSSDSFEMSVKNSALYAQPSLKTKDGIFEFSGVGTEFTSEANRITFDFDTLTFNVDPSVKCDVEIDSKKVDVPIIPPSEAVDDAPFIMFLLGDNRVAAGQKLTIKCPKEAVRTNVKVEDFQLVVAKSYDSAGKDFDVFSNIKANSSFYVGIGIVAVSTFASTLAVFF